MTQNSPMRTPGPMTASDETTAVGAIPADGSMGMNSYDKRRWNQTGRRRHGGAGAGAEGAEMAEERSDLCIRKAFGFQRRIRADEGINREDEIRRAPIGRHFPRRGARAQQPQFLAG